MPGDGTPPKPKTARAETVTFWFEGTAAADTLIRAVVGARPVVSIWMFVSYKPFQCVYVPDIHSTLTGPGEPHGTIGRTFLTVEPDVMSTGSLKVVPPSGVVKRWISYTVPVESPWRDV